jgi:N-acetylgalactosamine 4-sulfate 6-O-sulfotransferase
VFFFRLLSDYLFWSPKNRKTPQEFHELVEANLKTFDTCSNQHAFRFCLHDRNTHMRQLPIRPRAGLYYAYLKEWLNVFPRNQTLIVRFEDYITDGQSVLSKVFDFLGVRK